jgi:hypothetical protein
MHKNKYWVCIILQNKIIVCAHNKVSSLVNNHGYYIFGRAISKLLSQRRNCDWPSVNLINSTQ